MPSPRRALTPRRPQGSRVRASSYCYARRSASSDEDSSPTRHVLRELTDAQLSQLRMQLQLTKPSA